MKDKNGQEINVGDNVLVPDPNDTDIHNFSFYGTVTDIYDGKNTGLICVEDQDGDFFDIEAERLEIVDENEDDEDERELKKAEAYSQDEIRAMQEADKEE